MGEIHHIQQIINEYIKAKQKGDYIDYKLSCSEIIRISSKEKTLNKYDEDVFFCCYKTKYEDKPAILLLFTFRLPGPNTGSSAGSEKIMNLLAILEKRLIPIEYTYYDKELDSNSRTIGILKMVKVVNDDILEGV